MKILNTITTYDATNLGALLCLVVLISAIIRFFVGVVKGNKHLILYSSIALFLLFVFYKIGQRMEIPMLTEPYYQYEAILTEGEIETALEQYDIVERKGEIYILEERE